MVSFQHFVPDGNLPIYQQIIGFIKRGIVAGTIADGDELPSRRMLSALLGVNPNTVQKSYAILEEEGLMHSHPGAKSCIRISPETVQSLEKELLSAQIRAMVENMKQMGMTRAQAQACIEAYWGEEQ